MKQAIEFHRWFWINPLKTDCLIWDDQLFDVGTYYLLTTNKDAR